MHTPDYPCPTDTNSTLPTNHLPKFLTHLNSLVIHLKQRVGDWIATCNEPKITQQFDRQGRSTGWRVFDPETGYTIAFGSEVEVRLWLEHRYR